MSLPHCIKLRLKAWSERPTQLNCQLSLVDHCCSESRLNSLAMLSIEREVGCELDFSDVAIDRFALERFGECCCRLPNWKLADRHSFTDMWKYVSDPGTSLGLKCGWTYMANAAAGSAKSRSKVSGYWRSRGHFEEERVEKLFPLIKSCREAWELYVHL